MQTYTAKVRATPRGEIEVLDGGVEAPAYGPVEIAWYQDRLEIRAVGAGSAAVVEEHPGGRDIVVEIRPPDLDELTAGLPGAD